MDECLHGIPRDWCAVCKYGNKIYDNVPTQRSDEDDEFLRNLAKMEKRNG